MKQGGRHAQVYFNRDFASVCPKRNEFNAIEIQCKTKWPPMTYLISIP